MTDKPVADKPHRTLNDVLTEIIGHLDLSPAHRAELLADVGLLGGPAKAAPPPVASPGARHAQGA